MKRIIAALTSMALVIGLAGCSASGTGQDQQSGNQSDKTIEEQLGFTDRDRDPSYDEASATKIALDGSGASVTARAPRPMDQPSPYQPTGPMSSPAR